MQNIDFWLNLEGSFSMIKIKNLSHGGIMANYKCNAACRHCLYSCSPKREGGYITKEDAKDVAKLLYQNGCRGVHIGGGEPFLNFDGLIDLIKALKENKVGIDYIETNGFWASDEKRAKEYLTKLLSIGVDTLCISVDTFHAEYVPYNLPVKLSEYCRKYGMGSFLWKGEFLKTLSLLNGDKAHSRNEFCDKISSDYIALTADYYGISYGGRAVNIEEEYCKKTKTANLLDSNPCNRILSTNHYHIDMHKNFIPPGCTGINIPLEEITKGIEKGKYKVMDALLENGVKGIYDLAVKNGFNGEEGYTSKCNLCFHIRHFLSKKSEFKELNLEHYEASFTYY